jgi:very-short-patch-repair endonuclease
MDVLDGTGWPLAAEIATRQWGRITTKQLKDAGVSRSAIEKAVRSGRLHPDRRGVYCVGHRAESDHGRWMSAVLACGAGAVLSHRSAATLWRIRRAEGRFPDVTVEGNRNRPDIDVHRSPLPPDEVTVRDGIPVTTVARTLTDLAHVLDPDSLTRAVREAQFLRVFDLAATHRAIARRPSRALNGIIEEGVGAASALEDAFLRLLRRHRLPMPVAQKVLLGHPVDYVWEAQRVAVELDGFSAHVSFDAFQRDRSQSNALQLAGWLVLRFTYADVTRRSRQTTAAIRHALAM